MDSEKKILKNLNTVFGESKLVKALRIEKYQEPHNYEPSPEVLSRRLSTLREIKVYETSNGISCQHREPDGAPCKLKAQEHIMRRGVVVLLRKGTTQLQLVDECCKVTNILEKSKITGIAQVDLEE